jgi:rod shape-determining protein MreB
MLHRLLGIWRADLAIDLGTANTLISVAGEGLVLNEPSVVAVEQGTSRVLSGGCAVGHLAKQMLGRAPRSISVVRPLRDGVIADFRLCEAMLAYFLRKAQRGGRGARPRVVIAVPGAITPVERRAVFNSAQRAGAGPVYLVSQAVAAAIGCGLPIAEPVASMVCDIGGGTTEVAVVSLGERVALQSLRVAGDAMDRAIVEYVKRHYNLQIGAPTAERRRIDLGSAAPLPEEMTDEVSGLDRVSGLPRRATITSEEIRAALAAPLEEIVEAVKRAIDECSPDLAADLVDRGMVLAGGGSWLRGLARFLNEHTGLPIRVSPDALAAVAKGTQICLEHFADWRAVFESSDEEV